MSREHSEYLPSQEEDHGVGSEISVESDDWEEEFDKQWRVPIDVPGNFGAHTVLGEMQEAQTFGQGLCRVYHERLLVYIRHLWDAMQASAAKHVIVDVNSGYVPDAVQPDDPEQWKRKRFENKLEFRHWNRLFYLKEFSPAKLGKRRASEYNKLKPIVDRFAEQNRAFDAHAVSVQEPVCAGRSSQPGIALNKYGMYLKAGPHPRVCKEWMFAVLEDGIRAEWKGGIVELRGLSSTQYRYARWLEERLPSLQSRLRHVTFRAADHEHTFTAQQGTSAIVPPMSGQGMRPIFLDALK